jgi:hypothetical protein
MRNLNSCANNMFTLRNTGQSQCDGTQSLKLMTDIKGRFHLDCNKTKIGAD